MTGIGAWIRAKIAADATLPGLIGTRIYPIYAPQATTAQTLPYLTYQCTYTPADPNKTQRITAYNVQVEFTIWAEFQQYDTMETVDFALQDVLDFGEDNTTVAVAEFISSQDVTDEKMEYIGRSSTYRFRLKRS